MSFTLGARIAAATAKVEELALSQGLKTIEHHSGAVDMVVTEFAEWADQQVRWNFLGPVASLAESWDGRVIKAVASAFVHQALHHLESAGRLG